MSQKRPSLLGTRNGAQLTSDEIRRASNTFLGLDKNVNVRHDPTARSVFRVSLDEAQEQFGEIVFGPDIYPGSSVVDPNAALSLDAACAHELTHFHRWKDKTQLVREELEYLDEALTSLQAILRYDRHLTEIDVRQLVADAIQRLQFHIQDLASDVEAKGRSS